MLDFDGTLVDLAATPNSINVPADLLAMLNHVHQKSAGLTLITGRAIDDLQKHLPTFEGDIFGSHGAEKRVGGAYDHDAGVPLETLARLWQGADRIAAAAPDTLIAERKPQGVVLHYRRAPELAGRVHQEMQSLIQTLKGLEIHPSKMAIEARPDGITKADAAQAIIAQAARNTVPVFAGDDTTDEDAMRVVKDAHGVTIKIGEGDTVATHRLPTSQALRMLIQDWVKGA